MVTSEGGRPGPGHCERFSCARPLGHTGRHRNLKTVVSAAVPRIVDVFGRLGMSEIDAAELAQIAVERPEELKDVVSAKLAILTQEGRPA